MVFTYVIKLPTNWFVVRNTYGTYFGKHITLEAAIDSAKANGEFMRMKCEHRFDEHTEPLFIAMRDIIKKIPKDISDRVRELVVERQDSWPEDEDGCWITLGDEFDLNLFTVEGVKKADLRQTDGVKSTGYAKVDVEACL